MCVLETFSFLNLVQRGVLDLLVNKKVHGGEEEEGDDPCAEQPGPVGVIHDVGGI